MIPPMTRRTSSIWFSFKSARTRGTMALWAPERIESPMPETCVDHFHAGVAKGAGDDLGAAVVSIEAGLGDQDADGRCGGHRWVVSW
jgi:hypothetical protein